MPFENKLIPSPILVGRTKELEIWDAALRTVQEGRGQVVLVAGEAGVGKSRLVAEIRGRFASGARLAFRSAFSECYDRTCEAL
jgi:predicted ATPase